jgi:hypothetical protein
MGGKGGGIPSLSGSGGFFPSGPQLNPGALPVFDLMGWANSGGTQVQPQGFDANSLLSGIFGAPRQQAAPPPPPSQAMPRQGGLTPLERQLLYGQGIGAPYNYLNRGGSR